MSRNEAAPIKETSPPALFESECVATIQYETGDVLRVVRGLDERLAQQVVMYANDVNDTEMKEHTSDARRFADMDAYIAWHQKERYPFALVDESGVLAALVWYGPETLPGTQGGSGDEWDTIAFRAYPEFRGKRLMGDFSRSVLDQHGRERPDHPLWLEVDDDNEPARGLYERLGFEYREIHEESGRVVMCLD